jgi:hypothetical protein
MVVGFITTYENQCRVEICKLLLVYDYMNMNTNKLDKGKRDEIIKKLY